MPLADLLATAMATRYPIAVLNEDGHLVGVLDRASILAEVEGESEAPVTLSDRQSRENRQPNQSRQEEVE